MFITVNAYIKKQLRNHKILTDTFEDTENIRTNTATK